MLKQITIAVLGVVVAVSGIPINAEPTSAQSAARPRATAFTPANASNQSSNKVNITFTLDANGNTDYANKQVRVTLSTSNYSYNDLTGYPDRSDEQLNEQTAVITFSSATDTETVTMNGVPLLHKGSNYFVINTALNDGTGSATTASDGTTLDELALNYTGNSLPIYRFWSPRSGEAHFFTQDAHEKDLLAAQDNFYAGGNWIYERRAFTAAKPANDMSCGSQTQVDRFYSPRFKSHFYTSNATEKNQLSTSDNYSNGGNWIQEGVEYCADANAVAGTQPLYRFWSPRFKKHFYTAVESEKAQLITNDNYSNGGNWLYEKIDHYVLPS